MKTLRRLVRKRTEAPRRKRRDRTHGSDIQPVMNTLRDDLPSEVIELGNGPFEAAFPEIAARLAVRRR
ncbi:MAG: hypothetical protein MJE77_05400 [Proteobacteria bacterium]|nr:hypothetical protein [Pseudomonadota bacterium]